MKQALFTLLICILAVQGLVAQNERPKPLPDISLNIGYLHGFTDVALTSSGPTPISQLGYQLNISQQVLPFLNATFNLFTGKVRGDKTEGVQNLNFSSSIFAQTIGVEYNFNPLLKPDADGRQLVRPFIGVGFGAMQFRAKTDAKDAQGRTYYYWSDGKIYDQDESNFNPDNLVELTRDHEYETDVRDQNNDGLGKYNQIAFTMPITAGARFQFGKHIGANVTVGYMLNFTDLVDDVSVAGAGLRAGTSGFDNSLYASVGLTVFMGRTKPVKKEEKPEKPAVAKVKPVKTADTTATASSKKKTEKESEKVVPVTVYDAQSAPEPSFEEAMRLQEERNSKLLAAKVEDDGAATSSVVAPNQTASGETGKSNSSDTNSTANQVDESQAKTNGASSTGATNQQNSVLNPTNSQSVQAPNAQSPSEPGQVAEPSPSSNSEISNNPNTAGDQPNSSNKSNDSVGAATNNAGSQQTPNDATSQPSNSQTAPIAANSAVTTGGTSDERVSTSSVAQNTTGTTTQPAESNAGVSGNASGTGSTQSNNAQVQNNATGASSNSASTNSTANQPSESNAGVSGSAPREGSTQSYNAQAQNNSTGTSPNNTSSNSTANQPAALNEGVIGNASGAGSTQSNKAQVQNNSSGAPASNYGSNSTANNSDANTSKSGDASASQQNSGSEKNANAGVTSPASASTKPANQPAQSSTSNRTDADRATQEAFRKEAEKIGSKDVSHFHWADLDGSGRITPDEVLYYIDQLFEGSGGRTVSDIQDLIDYYFDQS